MPLWTACDKFDGYLMNFVDGRDGVQRYIENGYAGGLERLEQLASMRKYTSWLDSGLGDLLVWIIHAITRSPHVGRPCRNSKLSYLTEAPMEAWGRHLYLSLMR
eukprot:8105281-Pyramimonas_sp.AAC.1